MNTNPNAEKRVGLIYGKKVIGSVLEMHKRGKSTADIISAIQDEHNTRIYKADIEDILAPERPRTQTTAIDLIEMETDLQLLSKMHVVPAEVVKALRRQVGYRGISQTTINIYINKYIGRDRLDEFIDAALFERASRAAPTKRSLIGITDAMMKWYPGVHYEDIHKRLTHHPRRDEIEAMLKPPIRSRTMFP
ncbi:MAG: hypothetical protein JW834_02700 [Candidatus Diapherotrites archaeon]|nr:hypothetical protein [Candidatus Diapherotrites archaeon]